MLFWFFFSFQRNYSLHDSINVCRFIISNDIYFDLKFLFLGKNGKKEQPSLGRSKKKEPKGKKNHNLIVYTVKYTFIS